MKEPTHPTHIPGPLDLSGDESELLAAWNAGAARVRYVDLLTREPKPTSPAVLELAEREVAERPVPLVALGINARLVRLVTGARWFVIRGAIEDGASWADAAAALGEPVDAVVAEYRAALARQAAAGVPGYDGPRARAVLASAPPPNPVAGQALDLAVRAGASQELAEELSGRLDASGLLISPKYAQDIREQAQTEARAEFEDELAELRDRVQSLTDERDAAHRTVTEQQAELGALRLRRGEVLDQDVTVYRAAHDSIPMREYVDRKVAREHCEDLIRQEQPGAQMTWVPDDGSEDAPEELCTYTAAAPEDVVGTGYTVTPVTVHAAYVRDEDGEAW